jgi:hypothetical protein
MSTGRSFQRQSVQIIQRIAQHAPDTVRCIPQQRPASFSIRASTTSARITSNGCRE